MAILHGLARRTAPQTQGSAPGAAQAVNPTQERPQPKPGPVNVARYGLHLAHDARGARKGWEVTTGRAPLAWARAPVPSMPPPGAAHKKGPRAKPGPVGLGPSNPGGIRRLSDRDGNDLPRAGARGWAPRPRLDPARRRCAPCHFPPARRFQQPSGCPLRSFRARSRSRS